MSRDVVFLPEARDDISEAYSWYEEQSLGLGMDFLRCVEIATCTIARSPLMFPKVYKDYRRSLVRRFPYAVFYELSDEMIVVYSVFHCLRNPSELHERLT